MAVREDARRNHERLFPNHESTLEVTDPELIEVFDNWAFGELLEDTTLDARTRASEYRVMLGGARC
jgi:4-carboxymuconolactone decarboxylase